jgi:L-ascorbate metabolism protein UlaG (beta-lactamase superfamily)
VSDEPLGPRLASWRPSPDSIGIVALGQAGVAIRGRADLVLIDPFLTARPDRISDPPVEPAALRGVTAVLATHEHADHLDLPIWPAIAEASPEARFVVAAPLVPLVVESGIARDRVLGARPGMTMDVGTALVRPVPARHGIHVEDAYSLGPSDAPRWLGYVVEVDGVRLYHAGDSLSDPVIVAAVRQHRPQIAFLPINGRDAEREARDIVGNMTPDEAAEMARDLDVQLAVPIHFNGIRGNEGSPDVFVVALRRHHPAPSVWVPTAGGSVTWPNAPDRRT